MVSVTRDGGRTASVEDGLNRIEERLIDDCLEVAGSLELESLHSKSTGVDRIAEHRRERLVRQRLAPLGAKAERRDLRHVSSRGFSGPARRAASVTVASVPSAASASISAAVWRSEAVCCPAHGRSFDTT